MLQEGTGSNFYYTDERRNDMSNYVKDVVLSSSNVISTRITNLDADKIAGGSSHRFITDDVYNRDLNILGTLTTSNLNVIGETTISGQTLNQVNLDDRNSDMLQEGTGSNFYYTDERRNDISNYVKEAVLLSSNVISTRITNLDTDKIAEGLSHRFITNDIYDRDLNVLGTLTASNFNVIGETTMLNIFEYNAEKVHIIHDDYLGPALRIDHQTDITDEIMSMWKSDTNGTLNSIMMFKNNDNKPRIGIGKEYPQHELDVDGNVNANYFIGNGKNLVEINLNDRNSDMLQEGNGSNFYYTVQRRNDISNYVKEAVLSSSNAISTRITNLDADKITEGSSKRFITNDVYDRDLNILGTLTTSNLNVINETTINGNTINDILFNSITLDQVKQGTSNKHIINDVYSSDLYVAGKLMVTGIDIVDLDYIMSHEGTLSTVGNIHDYISLLTSNSVTKIFSSNVVNNILNNHITESIDDVYFVNYTTEIVTSSSNNISKRLNEINTDTIFQGLSNRFINNDEYNRDLSILGTLTTSNLNILNNLNGKNINNVNLEDRNSDMLSEGIGSNFYYTDERRNDMSNYIKDFVTTSSNIISTRITNLNADQIENGSSQRFIINDVYDTDMNILGTLTTSNINANYFIGNGRNLNEVNLNDRNSDMLSEGIGSNYYYTDERKNDMSNYVNDVISSSSNLISNRITELDADQIKDGSSHRFIMNNTYNSDMIIEGTLFLDNIEASGYINAAKIYGNAKNLNNVNFDDRNSDMLPEGIGSNYYYTDERRIHMSNFVYDMKNEITNGIQNITLDNVYQGTSNKYIINDVYSSDLYVAGKIMVTGIDIVDLDYIMSQEGSLSSAGNIYEYVSSLTSNTVFEIFSSNAINDILLEQINDSINEVDFSTSSNYLELSNQFEKLTLDQVSGGTSNKYIVNDVYSSDLYIAGKLMVTGIDIVDLDYIMSREGTLSSAGNIYEYVSSLTSNTMINIVSQEIDKSLLEIFTSNKVHDVLTEQINESINNNFVTSNEVNEIYTEKIDNSIIDNDLVSSNAVIQLISKEINKLLKIILELL